MNQSYEFYTERAKQAADEAAAATLGNVRERSERAQNTWSALAEQARKVRISRDNAIAAKIAAEHGHRPPNPSGADKLS